MPLIRLSPDCWTPLTPGAWAIGPQEVGWESGTAPSASAVLIETPAECWLIDCGAGQQRQDLLESAPSPPTALLMTHAHPDHTALLEHWRHLPIWMSHANPASWQHAHYVRGHWKAYRGHPLASSVSRSLTLSALPGLTDSMDQDESGWDQAVKAAILEAGKGFYGEPPSFAQTHPLEDLPLDTVQIAGHRWQGWHLGSLWIFPSRGHSPDQVVVWSPSHELWILSDETSAAPVWTDSDQLASFELQARVKNSLEGCPTLVGGHQSFAICGLRECEQFLERLLTLGRTLEQACRSGRDPDALFEQIAQTAWMQPFLRGQFPQGLFFAKQFVHNWLLRLKS